MVHYGQHSLIQLSVSNESYRKSLDVMINEQSFDLEEFVEKRVAHYRTISLKTFYQKGRHVLDDVDQSDLGGPFSNNVAQIIVKRVQSHLHSILDEKIKSRDLCGIGRFHHYLELQFAKRRQLFQFFELLRQNFDEDGQMNSSGQGKSGLKTELLLRFPQILNFCMGHWLPLEILLI